MPEWPSVALEVSESPQPWGGAGKAWEVLGGLGRGGQGDIITLPRHLPRPPPGPFPGTLWASPTLAAAGGPAPLQGRAPCSVLPGSPGRQGVCAVCAARSAPSGFGGSLRPFRPQFAEFAEAVPIELRRFPRAPSAPLPPVFLRASLGLLASGWGFCSCFTPFAEFVEFAERVAGPRRRRRPGRGRAGPFLER